MSWRHFKSVFVRVKLTRRQAIDVPHFSIDDGVPVHDVEVLPEKYHEPLEVVQTLDPGTPAHGAVGRQVRCAQNCEQRRRRTAARLLRVSDVDLHQRRCHTCNRMSSVSLPCSECKLPIRFSTDSLGCLLTKHRKASNRMNE